MPEWLLVIIRSVSILIGLFFILKLLGKKQLSELSFFETIVGITIGDIAGTLSMDLAVSLPQGLTAIAIWALAPFILDVFSVNNKKFRDFVQGKSAVFIKNGKIMEDNLKKEKITSDELLEMLRNKNVFRVADVEFATYEPTGDLSVLLKKENRPITLGDLNPNQPSEREAQTVIMDGKILNESLGTMGLGRGWLKNELDKLGVTIENVYLGQVDSYGQLTVDLYDDKIQVPEPVETKLLFASMKKCVADFELFSLQTENSSAKSMYEKNATKMEHLIEKVGKYLH
ncbi:DUF421 domain-containing protein [Bacillus salitolerans]|uniref:DUF421 domain-containing protein n=1 Tax=Bacillus salitolerans TaxID=1437434 RepID=A0ABW4LJI4_9BACI